MKKLRRPLRISAVLCMAAITFFGWQVMLPADLNKHVNRPGVVYWHGDSTKNKIALTFDDGPNEPYTAQILAVLKKYDVKATFFMVGKNVEKYPEAARAVMEAGHAIGNHSYTHPDMIFQTSTHVGQELGMTESAIEKATGKRPRIFRPPFGADDLFTFRQAEKMGYVIVKWSVSPRDWQRPGVDVIERKVLKHTVNGSIILMHDGNKTLGGDRSQTAKAIDDLIPELKAKGFEFVTVPELLDIDNNNTVR